MFLITTAQQTTKADRKSTKNNKEHFLKLVIIQQNRNTAVAYKESLVNVQVFLS